MLTSLSVSRLASCSARAGCLVAVATAVASAAEPVPIDIGSRRQLFVDRHIVERLEGEARLVLHHPQPQEIVLRCDQPWERSGPRYPTVFRDGDRYRLYYGVSAGQVDDGDQRQYTCYAESVDGITWKKPRLGLVEIDGSKDNNVIWTGAIAHNFSPFRDENPATDATERYKAVGGVGMKWGDGFWLLVSPDGIRWKKRDDTPLDLEGRFDSHNLLFWDAAARLYRMYWRDHRRDDGRQPGGRDVRTAASPDCRSWTASQWLVYEPARSGSAERDESDPSGDHHQFYASGIHAYPRSPGLLLGFPQRYSDRGWTRSTDQLPDHDVRRARADASRNGGRPTRWGTAITDVLFMTSHDGGQFFVWPEAFIRPGIQRPGSWYYGGAWYAWGLVETAPQFAEAPPELSLYVQEGDKPSRMDDARGALRRHTLRLDGFASVHAPLTGGTLVSRPLVFSGETLEINFATSAGGRVRIGLDHASGEPIAGRSLSDCDLLYGDQIDRVVSWGGDEHLGRLTGRPVRLTVELKDADLYALGFR